MKRKTAPHLDWLIMITAASVAIIIMILNQYS